MIIARSKSGRDKCFKCTVCGKYISYSDIDGGKVKHVYTPDTEYTVEDNKFTHIKCIKRE
jgi:hypothetical protein